MSRSALLLALACALCAGCHVDINDPGSDPPAGIFYFPSGVAMDPDGVHLYVSNANADLRYGGGTVQIVDTQRFDCAYRAFVGLPLDPGVDCSNATSDAKLCAFDSLDPGLVNCGPVPNFSSALPNVKDPLPFIVGDGIQTVRVGNFAGQVVVQKTPGSTTQRRLFVAVRGDPSVTFIDVDLHHDTSTRGMLDCFDGAPPTGQAPPACAADHVLQNYDCVGKPICTMTQNTLPPEPFGMALDEGTLDTGSAYSRLLVAHQAGGQVSLIDTSATPQIVDVSPAFFTPVQQSAGMTRNGAFALAAQHPGSSSTAWYLTSNLQPVISTFRVADLDVVVPATSFSIGGAFTAGSDVRDVVFDEGGNRAFLTENNPPSVVVLDTRPQVTGSNPGSPSNQVVDIVDVCQTPSHLKLLPVDVPGAPGQPARHTSRLYVVCFLSNQVMVVDPDLPAVLDTILVGRGPNDLAFNITPDNPHPAHPYAYVTNFGESTIGVIDLDPTSPTWDRMVARIGMPVPPPTPGSTNR